MVMEKNKDWFINKLIEQTRFSSRRSFLSRATNILFGVAGAAVASKIPLFAGAPLEAKRFSPADRKKFSGTQGENCGLHGYLCGYGNCNTGETGTGYTRAWNACCSFPDQNNCPKWHCCTYEDWCSNTIHNPLGCSSAGTTVAGIAWCGVGGGLHYVCTDVYCDSIGKDNYNECSCSTYPDCDYGV